MITDLVAVRGYDVAVARDWIAQIRAAFPKAKVIVSTTHVPAAASRPEGVDGDAIMAKPFIVPVFLETMDALLGD